MAADTEVQDILDRIQALDECLIQTFSERLALCKQLGQLEDTRDQLQVEAEAALLKYVASSTHDADDRASLVAMFREMLGACRRVVATVQVAVLGPEGTYCEAAAQKHFGQVVETTCQATIEDVFRKVESGAVAYGVVPVENSTEGGVNTTLDCFQESALNICGEINLPIRHCLMSASPDRETIREILSHAQSLAQCRRWLASNFPSVPVRAVSSNAEAARLAGESLSLAAIAAESTAELYGLNLLERGIQDIPDNTTRFFIICRHNTKASGNDRTSLMLSAYNKPGALFALLKPLADHGVSMTKIESRPARGGLWEYMFFVDCEGHCQDPGLAPALEELRHNAALFRILGSYPVAVE